MRLKKPQKASFDQVKITREGEYAIIENADPTVSVMHLKIGTEIRQMSDQDILDLFNDVIDAQDVPNMTTSWSRYRRVALR